MAQNRVQTVRLQITGSVTVLRERVRVDTLINRTWADLLNGQLGLRLGSGVKITNSQLRRGDARRGWTASLSDRIDLNINSSRRNQTLYRVFLVNSHQTQRRQRIMTARNSSAVTRDQGNVNFGPILALQNPPNRTLLNHPTAVTNRTQHNASAMVNRNQLNFPALTTRRPAHASVAVNEGQQSFKELALARFGNFSDTLLRRVCHEFNNLPADILMRIMQRAPLSFSFIANLVRNQ